MFCKWCGMESETSDVCSWCRKPFSAAATAPSAPEAAPVEGPAPAPPAPPVEPVITAARPPAAPSPGPVALGDAFGEEMDDDLSPLPFGGPIRPPAPEPPASRQVPPPATPPAQRPTVPPAYTPPPVSPGRGGPGYTPAQARQPEDGRQLEALPLKRPSALPLARQPLPGASRPPAPAPPPPVTPPASATPPPLPLRRSEPPTTAPPQVAPPAPRAPLSEPPAEEAPLVAASLPETVEAALDLPLLEDASPEEPQEEIPLALPPNRRPEVGIGAAPLAHPVAPPPTPQAVMVPRAGGRTWYCRWCGMESDTADTCSWCHKDLRHLPSPAGHAAQVTITHSPSNNRRSAPRPPAKRQPSPPPAPRPTPKPEPPAPATGMATAGAPQIGTFQAQKSKYYTDKVLDAVSGTHYDADTGRAEMPAEIVPVEVTGTSERNELIRQLGIYAVSLVVIIGLTAALGAAAKNLYLFWLGVGSFAAAIIMPVIGVAPYAEDDSDDFPLAIALILILGPFVGGVLYGILCVMKQSWNPAIAGVFLSYLLIRLGLDAAIGQDMLALFTRMLPSWDNMVQWGARVMPLAGIAGWYSASVFHKTDE